MLLTKRRCESICLFGRDRGPIIAALRYRKSETGHTDDTVTSRIYGIGQRGHKYRNRPLTDFVNNSMRPVGKPMVDENIRHIGRCLF